MVLDSQDAYPFALASLCCWREARGEPIEAKIGQAWCIRNRVDNPSWWGKDWVSVILKPYQFSAFNAGDPNATKFPQIIDASWQACLQAVEMVWNKSVPDPTNGATHYFDKSLDSNHPAWAKDGSMIQTVAIGGLRFWKHA